MDNSNIIGTIPSAWLKAKEALEKVHQEKEASATSPVVMSTPEQSAATNTYNYTYPYWPQMYGYSPYAAMPGYGNYYNMAMQGGYGAYYGYPTMPAPQQQPSATVAPSTSVAQQLPATPCSPKTSGVPLNQLTTQPPPPPPSPPKAEDDGLSFSQRMKQAPGAGGIRFSIAKRNPQKGNSLQEMENKKRNKKENSFNQQKNLNFPHFIPLEDPMREKKDSSTDGLEHMGFDARETECWPQSIKDYIKRCFANCTTKLQKDRMAIILKGRFASAVTTNTFWKNDWDAEPVLSLCEQQPQQSESEVFSSPDKSHALSRLSPSLPKSFSRQRNSYKRSRSYSRSRSRSRSRSPSPHPRRVVQRREHSSGSSSSNSSNGNSTTRKQSLCSSVVTPGDLRGSTRFVQNSRSTSRKKKNKKKVLLPYVPVDAKEAAENEVRLQRRAARFKPAAGKKGGSLMLTVNNIPSINLDDDDEADIDWGSYAINGTCEDVEKPYLRITSAVDPSTIRPQEILVKSLAMVKEHWKNRHDYRYACEQLKSIRQDLVVQCIRNSFTVSVYEMHARIAMEKGDHTEFNQCQSQLKVLYEELNMGNQEEFAAYRILYNMYTKDTREIKNILSTLSDREKRSEVVSHALSLNIAWTLNNFHVFFKLYLTAPKMAGFIIDWFIGTTRKSAMKSYMKSYRPTLPVAFVQKELGFSTLADCLAFLDELNVIYSDDKSCIMCKESVSSLTA